MNIGLRNQLCLPRSTHVSLFGVIFGSYRPEVDFRLSEPRLPPARCQRRGGAGAGPSGRELSAPGHRRGPPGAPRSGPAAFPLAAGHKRPRAGPARWARPPQGPPRAAPGTHRQGRAGLRQRRALPADRRNVTTRPHPLRASAAGAAAGRAVKGVPRNRVPANGGSPQNSPAPP